MLEDDAALWRFAPDTLLKALVLACEGHGARLDAEIDALIERGDRKAVRQPWGTSTTASALKDPQPAIYRLRAELESELPAALGKLLRLAQLEQQREYINRSATKGVSPAANLSADLPARIKAALSRERKARIPEASLFHAALIMAHENGVLDHPHPSAPSATDEAPGGSGLGTGFVLPPADFETSGRPIPRAYWDAVRIYPFHCPIDLPVTDGIKFGYQDDPMPQYASYGLMIANDSDFAFWAGEARERFAILSMRAWTMCNIPRAAEESRSKWADRIYAGIVAQVGEKMPDYNLSELIDEDNDILTDRERLRVWWHWAERRWAIQGFLSQRHDYRMDDDLLNCWLFLLVGRHVTDEWLLPAWVRARLFDWKMIALFATPVPAFRYLVPRSSLVPIDLGCKASE